MNILERMILDWFPVKVMFFITGIVLTVSGGFLALSAYRERNLLENCVSGQICPIGDGPSELTAKLGATRAELDVTLAVVGLGLVLILYALLFVSSKAKDSTSSSASKEDAEAKNGEIDLGVDIPKISEN